MTSRKKKLGLDGSQREAGQAQRPQHPGCSRQEGSEGSKAQRRQQMAQTLGEVSGARVRVRVRARGVGVGDNQDSFTQPRICD